MTTSFDVARELEPVRAEHELRDFGVAPVEHVPHRLEQAPCRQVPVGQGKRLGAPQHLAHLRVPQHHGQEVVVIRSCDRACSLTRPLFVTGDSHAAESP